MKTIIGLTGLLVGSSLLIAASAGSRTQARPVTQPEIVARSKKALIIDGWRFKDLNADGALQPYEDWRLPAAARANDLVARSLGDRALESG